MLAGIVAAFARTDTGRARQLADRAAARLNTDYDADAIGDIAAELADADPAVRGSWPTRPLPPPTA